MKTPVLLLMAVVALIAGSPARAATDPARASMAAGLKAFEQGDFATAATNFQTAAGTVAQGGLDPAVATYNQGNALFRQGQFKEAMAAYDECLKSGDIVLQSHALHNAGLAGMKLADAAFKEQKAVEGETHLLKSVEHFTKALLLNPGDFTLKTNFELASQQMQQLKAAIEALEKTLGDANRLITSYQFAEAAALLQGDQEKHALAFALREKLGKQYQELQQRCSQVQGIIQSVDQLLQQQQQGGSET
jgi:tetratricopeptide (TPR) repeat protein